MYKKMLLLFSTSLLFGCASVFDTPFVPEFYRPNAVIEYRQVQNRIEFEQFCGHPKENESVLGCAQVPSIEQLPCYITTYKNPPEWLLDHERKHCIYGKWHD